MLRSSVTGEDGTRAILPSTNPMASVLFLLLMVLAAAVLGRLVAHAFESFPDPAARFGVYGLIGLGLTGTLVYIAGLLFGVGPALPRVVVAAIPVILLLLFVLEGRRSKPPRWGIMHLVLPRGPTAVLCLGGVLLAVAIGLTGVLTPSTALDWDSLAYHLAVPKIWLSQGHIRPITFIHHSNFPAAADSLFLLGLAFGGQATAKGFMFLAYIFGLFAVFGLARQRYGERAGWIAALSLACVPMAVWEAGSAYIDGIHGLYAGLGLWLLADDGERRAHWSVPALLLGLALGTKYTGLQAVSVGAVLVLLGARRREVLPFLVLALAVGGFWYVKNVLWTGNPVFPFYYSLFGGKNWDGFSARIYAEEQSTFGIGRGPGAILGLVAIPSRFTNPAPLQGLGFPFVALGAGGLAALIGWGVRQETPRPERRALLAAGLVFALWILTSEQSRYILALAPIMAILAGGLGAHSRGWRVIAGLNAALGLFVLTRTLVPDRLPYLSGGLTAEEYTGGFTANDGARVPGKLGFSAPAAWLNANVGNGRVALYDEVFGYLLDVPYIWANPGHSTELGYDRMQTGADLVAALKREGVTYVYLNLTIVPSTEPAEARFEQALGTGIARQPYSPEEARKMDGDLRTKWKRLLADAVDRGLLMPETSFGRRLVYRLG